MGLRCAGETPSGRYLHRVAIAGDGSAYVCSGMGQAVLGDVWRIRFQHLAYTVRWVSMLLIIGASWVGAPARGSRGGTGEAGGGRKGDMQKETHDVCFSRCRCCAGSSM
jgi:hypothetical protein